MCVIFVISWSFVALSNADRLAEAGGFICVVNYLRSQKLLDLRVGYTSKENNILTRRTECDSKITKFINDFNTKSKKTYEDEKNSDSSVNCVIEYMKRYRVAEVSLKRLAYEYNTNLSRRKRQKALKDIDYEILKKTSTAEIICISDEYFGKIFDDLYGDASDLVPAEDLEDKDWCLRKHMKEFNDTTVYDRVNPLNINITALNCEEIIKNFTNADILNVLKAEFGDDMMKIPSKHIKKCMINVLRINNLMESNVRTQLLFEFKISDEKKSEEREKFIEESKQLYVKMFRC